MPKISLAGFKDPRRRPRYIIWCGTVLFGLIAFVILALGVTSSYWFCADVCHKVQDDTITAYNNSTHSEISCMACHMPANSDPITFVLHKMAALGELYLTATENYEIPLNHGSHLAMDGDHMPSRQCTQCHSENREVTASPGIIIDHEVHDENDVHCTVCHNRIAHNEEGIEMVNVDPATGVLNIGHPDFMEMTACFRCHSLETDAMAPGACSACHPADFQLKPPSHFEEGFYPGGHAELAHEEIEKVEGGGAHGEEADDGHGEETSEDATEHAEGEAAEEATDAEHAETAGEEAEADDAHAEEATEDDAHADEGHEEGLHGLPTVDEINECYTCHLESFCLNCHGMEIPHPAEFLEESHGQVAAEQMDNCDMCHQVYETTWQFCNDCHHGSASDWEFDPAVEWQTQHADAVTTNGVEGCLEACHEKKFCQDCHNELKPVPSSHGAKTWLHNELTITNYPDEAAKPSADHAVKATQAPDSCEVCHGEGGPNAKFCSSCHGYEMPHPDDFKEFHSKTGRDNPDACQDCHQFKEVCSNCHHTGSSTSKPWEQVHGGVVNESGAESCFDPCHGEKKFCVDCHNAEQALPASHDAKDWTRRASVDTPAKHPAGYDSNAESCTYCHGDGSPNDNKFCSSCHYLEMPHPSDFKDSHGPDISDGAMKRSVCENCHVVRFCNACHHEKSTGKKPWELEHPSVVKADGADPCFECHEPTYCAECHVGLSR